MERDWSHSLHEVDNEGEGSSFKYVLTETLFFLVISLYISQSVTLWTTWMFEVLTSNGALKQTIKCNKANPPIPPPIHLTLFTWWMRPGLICLAPLFHTLLWTQLKQQVWPTLPYIVPRLLLPGEEAGYKAILLFHTLLWTQTETNKTG